MAKQKQQSAHKGTLPFQTLQDQEHNKGESNAFKQQTTGKGLDGVSGAKDPDFEKKAAQFEMRFGTAAMGHGSVTAAVDVMMQQIAAIVTAEWQTTKSQQALDLEAELGKACGTRPDMKGVAGAVPKDKVMEHMLGGSGNVRTKMTALFNFGRPFQSKLEGLNKSGKTAEFVQKLKDNTQDTTGGSTDALEAKAKDLAENGGRLTPSPTDASATNVAIQASTRGESSQPSAWQSTRTAEQVGLTDDEVAFQGLDKDDSDIQGDPMQKRVLWEEGARKWMINEDNAWVAEIRSLSLPLKAGPSGTTDRIMQTRELLGVSTPSDTRAACLAYLLPINAHSMVEIMEASRPFGLPFTAGQGMYRSLEPFGSLEAYAPDAQWWQQVVSAGETE